MKTETITYRELKKIIKLSISIDIELGFYIAYSQRTITIDRYDNWNDNKTKLYKFESKDAEDILRLINAYAIIYKRKIIPH
jgi:hypothetical protein